MNTKKEYSKYRTILGTIWEELEKNGSSRVELFIDEDRRAMRIRVPIHPAFLEKMMGI